MWETASWNSLKFAVVVFCGVLILLHELSVVIFLIQGPDLLVDRISQLKTLGLRNFAVVKGVASEMFSSTQLDGMERGESFHGFEAVDWKKLSTC